MSFQSFSFLAFLAVTLAVCLTVGRKNRAAGMLLLAAANVVFYVWGGGWKSFFVLLMASSVTLSMVRLMRMSQKETERRRAFVAGALVHVLLLTAVKYSGFLTGGAVKVPFVPLGISFFTFQQLWLLKEVYTGQFRLEEDWKLLLQSLFFPCVTSGPILRPGSFFPQLEGEKFLRPDGQDIAAGLYAIAVGMGKKVLLADSFGVVVNNGWARLSELNAPAAWLVILGYTFQLYFDFSGYCDIATGCARLLGIHLPVNFNSPYRSLSVGEFWKRWHITLTTFLRECLYFPLGGSRKGPARTYLHILIVFLVSGIWHGAGWTFIVWGALHGLAQIAERLWGKRRDRMPAILRWGLTFAFVNLAWVFFRAPNFSAAAELLSAAVAGGIAKPEAWLLEGLFSKETGAMTLLIPALKSWQNILRLAVLYGAGILAAFWPRNTIAEMEEFKPSAWKALALAVLLVWSVLSFTGVTTFIYSNF